jgi:hypothetical protein
VKAGGKLALLATCIHVGILLAIFFDPVVRRCVPMKRRLTLNGLQVVVSQKVVLLKPSALRISDPTYMTVSDQFHSQAAFKFKFLASLVQKKDYPYTLQLFESGVPRRTFVPKTGEVTQIWRKLHIYGIHNLYPLPTVISVITSRKMNIQGM